MRLPRKCRFSSRASHIPSASLKMVAQTCRTNVLQTARWKIESFQVLMKFLSPTKTPGFPTLVLVRESQTPMTNG